MKKQFFEILYENENNVQFKMIKTYLNRFIIDDDAECEVMKISTIQKSPEFEFSEYRLIRKIQSFYINSELIRFSDFLISAIKMIQRSQSYQDHDYQVHCIFGISLETDLFFYYFTILFSVHCSVLLIRSKSVLSEKELRSLKKPQNDSIVTIGDDIDFFIDKFHGIKPILLFLKYFANEIFIANKFFNGSEPGKLLNRDFDYLSFCEESEDSSMKIKCHRNFFPRQEHVIRSSLFFGTLIIMFFIGSMKASIWYLPILQKFLNFILNYINQNFLINFYLCCIALLSVIYVQLKCFSYFRKFWYLIGPIMAMVHQLFQNHLVCILLYTFLVLLRCIHTYLFISYFLLNSWEIPFYPLFCWIPFYPQSVFSFEMVIG